MSIPTPAPTAELDFDAAVDAYVDAPQRPPDDGTATPPAQDPSPREGMAPSAAQGVPAASDAGEPAAPTAATTDQPQETIDYKAEYERLHQEATSRAGAELSAAGRLKQANAELERLRAENAQAKQDLADADGRFTRLWENAIAEAPDQSDDPRIATKAELRDEFAKQKRSRDLDQREQRLTLAEQQRKEQQQTMRGEAERTARHYAVTEVLGALDVEAQQANLPPEVVKPIKDWLTSPEVQLLARTLPLVSQTVPPPDIRQWTTEHLDDLNKYRTWLVYQTVRGFDHQKRQHEAAQVAKNAAAAAATYQPERAVGAGVGPQRREWDDLDFDEAVDAVFTTR